MVKDRLLPPFAVSIAFRWLPADEDSWLGCAGLGVILWPVTSFFDCWEQTYPCPIVFPTSVETLFEMARILGVDVRDLLASTK
jgi:hypothetical protein